MWKAMSVLLFFAAGLWAGSSGRFLLLWNEFTSTQPSARTRPGPLPHEIVERRKGIEPPVLKGSGDEARRAALEFLAWASASTAQDAERVRSALAEARANSEIAESFCEEAQHTRESDHTRALLALALLGEMKSATGEKCFVEFLAIPPPAKGTVVEGEMLERTALAELQAKAVDGLAFMGAPRAREEVLRVIREHPLRIVRAEAINAYLWNNQDSPEAKAQLRKIVNKEDQIFIDRIRRNSGEKAESFNRKLEQFLKAHPEVLPPAPARSKEREREQEERKRLPEPPRF